MNPKMDAPQGLNTGQEVKNNKQEKVREILEILDSLLNKPRSGPYNEPPDDKFADWKELNKFLDSLENDPIFKTTDLAVQMHEKLLKHTSRHDDSGSYYDDNANDVSKKIVLLMGENSNNLEYMKSIFLEQKMPEEARYSFDSMEEGDEFLPSYYYIALIHSLAKIKKPETVEFIEKMLMEIDQQNDAYFAKQKEELLASGVKIEEAPEPQIFEEGVEVFNYEEWFGDPLGQYEETGNSWSSRFHYGENSNICLSFKEEAIKILGEVGNEKTIDVLRRFLVSQGWLTPVFFDDLLFAFQKLDQSKSVSMLLDLAKSSPENIKKNALALLYRMEVGKVGVSEDGVHFLQKIYNIGPFNGPAFYFAQRITRKGQVGIFERKSEKFQKYFQLDGLNGEQTMINARIMDLTYETLFTPGTQETEERKKEREYFLNEFQEKYFGFLNGEFFNVAGVRFNDLSFEEQAQFMMFYEKSNDTTKKKVIDFCGKFGLNGFQVFLSLDQGEHMGESILKIGESYRKETAKEIFAKYLEIANMAENIEIFMDDILSQEQQLKLETNDFLAVRNNLLLKAKDLLIFYSNLSTQEDGSGQNNKILAQLEQIKTEVFLFASTFKVLSLQEDVKLTDIQGSMIEIKDSLELTKVEKESMVRIFKENRGGYSPELLKETLGEFEQALNTKGHEFQILRFNNEIIAFVRFDRLSNGNLYAGSLNVRTEIRGSAIGSAMLHATLDKKAEKYNVEAIVYEKNPMLNRYISDFGFQIVGEIENYHGTGQKFYKLYIAKAASDSMLEKAA